MEGEVKERKSSEYASELFSYFVLLCGTTAIYSSLSIGLEPIGQLTTGKVGYAFLFAWLSVIITICCRLNVSMPEELKLQIEEAARRSELFQKPMPEELKLQIEEEVARRSELLRKPIPGVSKAIADVKKVTLWKVEEGVEVQRGGEFIGNRMRFKVKVLNDSPFTITDVTIYLISYPNESLMLEGKDISIHLPKINSKEQYDQTFDFLPTQDCVRGEINAGITFVDYKGKVHTLSTKPFAIRSVCDLLLPHRVTPEQFELKLKELECGEVTFKIDEWTPKEMYEKGLRIVDESNFFEVTSEIDSSEGAVYAKISGYARGKYTRKAVAVVISITGASGMRGASCKISVSGEDEAMILPAIDDLRERLSAWLCPICSSPISVKHVEDIREGKVVECPFCNVTIGR